MPGWACFVSFIIWMISLYMNILKPVIIYCIRWEKLSGKLAEASQTGHTPICGFCLLSSLLLGLRPSAAGLPDSSRLMVLSNNEGWQQKKKVRRQLVILWVESGVVGAETTWQLPQTPVFIRQWVWKLQCVLFNYENFYFNNSRLDFYALGFICCGFFSKYESF